MIKGFPHINISKEPISNFYLKKKVIFKEVFWAVQVTHRVMKSTYYAIAF